MRMGAASAAIRSPAIRWCRRCSPRWSSQALLAATAQACDAHEVEASLGVLVAKYHATQAAVTASHHAVQILGARGCAADSAVQRFYRDAKIMEIIEGSTEVLASLIAA